MMRSQRKALSVRNLNSQAGMAILEALIAIAILLVVAAGVMGLAGIAVTTTENQGHLAARTAEYAQDKMEQLLALTWCDGGTDGKSGTDTTVFPAVVGAGTGLAGCTNLTNAIPTPSIGGSVDPTAPAAGYVDYLDTTGAPGTAANYQYVRLWQISVPANTTGIKQITVTVQARKAVGGQPGLLPQSTIAAWKTYPF
jgi:hypothetical protein